MYDDLLRTLEKLLYGGRTYRPDTYIGQVVGVPIYYSPMIESMILGDGIVNACVFKGRIFVNNEWMKAPERTRMGIIAHEIGHIINGDLDPVRRLYGPGRYLEMEIAADHRAVMILGKDAVLDYLYLLRDQHIALRRKSFKWGDPRNHGVKRNIIEMSKRIEAII